MIFVTVGTHEQPFDRLVRCMDEWASEHDEEVIIQTGFSTYAPQHCKWSKLYPYPEMVRLVGEARIVITHGGPSSFIMPLQIGKIPIVVPRKKEFNEHVNDHQAEFANAVAKRKGNIVVVENVAELGSIIGNYTHIIEKMPAALESNNAAFNKRFEEIVQEMFR